MKKSRALDALSGLAQESRLDIVRLLVAQGPEGLSAGVIAERLGMPNATLSFHLAELARARLVQARPKGRHRFYVAGYTTLGKLVDFLTANCCQGEACAARPARPSKACAA